MKSVERQKSFHILILKEASLIYATVSTQTHWVSEENKRLWNR